ncbi:hypothetical protein [Candidatus Magnetaquicoccus inordinatus]
MRHAFASGRGHVGLSLPVVGAFLGHSSTSITVVELSVTKKRGVR